MKYKIILTKRADTDLGGIYEYIVFILFGPKTAARQLDRIEKGILSLNEMPERFRLFEK
jgi:toxin ParE1/3/4